jgi:hypothetical protein
MLQAAVVEAFGAPRILRDWPTARQPLSAIDAIFDRPLTIADVRCTCFPSPDAVVRPRYGLDTDQPNDTRIVRQRGEPAGSS